MANKLPIALSNRHAHLNQDDIEKLFGKGHELCSRKDLLQPGQFACEETVDLIGPKRSIKKVRVLGPKRGDTQIEISLSDGFTLGLKAPIRNSGDLEGSPGIRLKGPKGEIEIEKGVIAAARHIHMSEEDAEKFGVEDKDIVKIKTEGPRALIFDNVLIRVNKKYVLEMHVDIEEGNAAGVKNNDLVELIK